MLYVGKTGPGPIISINTNGIDGRRLVTLHHMEYDLSDGRDRTMLAQIAGHIADALASEPIGPNDVAFGDGRFDVSGWSINVMR